MKLKLIFDLAERCHYQHILQTFAWLSHSSHHGWRVEETQWQSTGQRGRRKTIIRTTGVVQRAKNWQFSVFHDISPHFRDVYCFISRELSFNSSQCAAICCELSSDYLFEANFRAKIREVSREKSGKQRTKFTHFVCITFSQYCSNKLS